VVASGEGSVETNSVTRSAAASISEKKLTAKKLQRRKSFKSFGPE
jgi:hypothetical protein